MDDGNVEGPHIARQGGSTLERLRRHVARCADHACGLVRHTDARPKVNELRAVGCHKHVGGLDVVVVVVERQVTGNVMFPFWVSDIPITYGYCGKPCPIFAR